MSFVKEVSNWILNGVKEIIDSTDNSQIKGMKEIILESRQHKILLIGSGRSGFVGRAFALRLMNIGFNVYVGGETITPALDSKDLVIAVSGSGTTTTVVAQADVAREIGAKIIAVTSQIESPLGKVADLAVVIKGRTKEDSEIDYMRRQITGEYNMAPLGTMFELSAMIFLDGLIADLMKELGKSELDLKQRHANAE